MFERFTKAAGEVVRAAVREAEHAGAAEVSAEHLLLALVAPGSRSAGILTAAGVTRVALLDEFAAIRRWGGLTDAEAAALREFGIDVDTVVERVERSLGEHVLAGATPRRRSRFGSKGHLPFCAEAKAVLEGALREARDRRDREIGDEHVLLALAAVTRVPAQVLTEYGLSYVELRARTAMAS